MRPTVIINVPDDSRSMQEEIFGPVTCINSFKSEEEVSFFVFASLIHIDFETFKTF